MVTPPFLFVTLYVTKGNNARIIFQYVIKTIDVFKLWQYNKNRWEVNTLLKVLQEARVNAKLTQGDIAFALKISRSFYALIEGERRRPNYGQALQIARMVDRPVEEVFPILQSYKLNTA